MLTKFSYLSHYDPSASNGALIITLKHFAVKIFLLLFLLTASFFTYGQGDSLSLRRNISALQQYAAKHPIEKVHLHLDRPWYGLGDTIWFKAYTVAGPSHAPSLISTVLYTELINDRDSVINGHILQLNQGMGQGDFAIPYTYKSGAYRLRAYTNYMRNDSDYFFDQRIFIGGLSNSIAASSGKLTTGNPDVQFFPEGGELVNGLRSRVAFKAISSSGLAENITGTITDQDGNEAASFNTSHAGMGEFALTPQPGRRYKAKLICADGSSYLIELPQAKETGFTLSVNGIGDSLYVKVAANELLYKNNPNASFYLIAQSGGQVYYTASNKLANAVFTAQVPKSRFPSGIVQFTLFSQSGEPLNERVVFVQNNDQLKLDITTDKQSYAPTEKVTIALDAKTAEQKAAEGSFSVSVTDETKVPADEQTEPTLFTDLLLTSELKGHIENPNYYFTSQNDKIRSDLDLLMLTQGYRRFEWKKILSDNTDIFYQPEAGLSLSGMITTPGHKPVAGAKVRLTSVKDYFAADTLTDANGHFTFSNISLPDSTKVVINAKKPKGSDNVNIAITSLAYAPVNKMAVTTITADTIPIAVKEAMEKTYLAGRQLSLKNTIQLKEVNIKERKRNPVFEPVYSDNMKFSSNLNGPGNADQVVLGDQITRGGGGLLSEILQSKIFGLKWSSGSGGIPYSLRASHISGNHPMAIFVEGGQISPNELDDINPYDIYSIEVLTSISRLSIYGSDAPSGALIITLKHGVDPIDTFKVAVAGLIVYRIHGFYKSRNFYSPKYDVRNSPSADDRKTIYWNPDLITDASGKASFEFFNGGSPGVYRVVVEGIDGYGNLGRQVFRYKVE